MFFLSTSCQDNSNSDLYPGGGDNPPAASWLIPINEVYDGGPGKDGIPALVNPFFINAAEATYLSDNQLVLGFKGENEVRAYPHSILDYHEIINDDIGNHSIAIVYCPLTGTGIGWDRTINGTKTTFGVSGLLYNTNLIPYDRLTNSNWSQMLLKCVNGELSGNTPSTYNLIETTWGSWKKMYPSTKVVSSNTGYSRNYNVYPYGSYLSNSLLLFPVSNQDERLPMKERVLGIIISGEAKAYSIENFGTNSSLINDVFEGVELSIIGNKTDNFVLAFNRELSGTVLNFQIIQDELPAIMIDDEGTTWDVFGNAMSGPRAGQKLESITQFMGYWFSWGAFYPNIDVYAN